MIKIIGIERLEHKDYRRLRAMTLGDRGLMQYYLESAYAKDTPRLRYRRREQAHILYSDNKMLGWRLFLQYRNCSICRWKNVVHVYVREKYRGKGNARKLLMNVIDSHPKDKLYCHGNNKFFKHFKIKNVN